MNARQAVRSAVAIARADERRISGIISAYATPPERRDERQRQIVALIERARARRDGRAALASVDDSEEG